MDPHELVTGLLDHFGYQAKKIAEDPTRKTPDFRCETQDATFVFELKTREADAKEASKRRSVLQTGEVYGFSQSVGRRNTVSGLIDDAVEQLAQHVETDVFRVVFLYTGDERVEMRATQFKASLYGMEAVTSLDWSYWMNCLYFRHSDFFRHRVALDGAIVMQPGERGFDATFFLNDHAPHYRTLAELALPQKFGNGLFLPHARERDGEVLIADTDADRADESAVLRYLSAKYKLSHLQTIAMGYHEATVHPK